MCFKKQFQSCNCYFIFIFIFDSWCALSNLLFENLSTTLELYNQRKNCLIKVIFFHLLLKKTDSILQLLFPDDISSQYVCMSHYQQKDHDIAKSKETSRLECAKVCQNNAECVGFEYNPNSKDCHLTSTTWREFSPTGLSYWWACEKKDGKRKCNFVFDLISEWVYHVHAIIFP